MVLSYPLEKDVDEDDVKVSLCRSRPTFLHVTALTVLKMLRDRPTDCIVDTHLTEIIRKLPHFELSRSLKLYK